MSEQTYPPMSQRYPCPPWVALCDAKPGENVVAAPRGPSLGAQCSFEAWEHIRKGDRLVFDDEGKAHRA